MADMIADAAGFMAAPSGPLSQKSNVSQTVTVIRGNSSCNLQVTMQEELLRIYVGQGNSRIERPDISMTCTAADYNFGSGPILPASGDVIQLTIGGVVQKFKVMPQASHGEMSWRQLPYGIQLWIRAKYIGNV
jgi:hypothetical protein